MEMYRRIGGYGGDYCGDCFWGIRWYFIIEDGGGSREMVEVGGRTSAPQPILPSPRPFPFINQKKEMLFKHLF